MIYILMFAISIALLYASKKFKKNSFLQKLIVVAAISLPCIVAGLRSSKIGTDVTIYVERWFHVAVKSKNFFSMFDSIKTTDVLYVFLNYIVSRFTSDIRIFLFVAQAITIIPIYFVLSKNKNDKASIIGIAIYYLFFYNISLNLMRQSISLSMSLLAYYFLKNKKIKNSIVFTVIATLFHFSGILGIYYFLVTRIKTNVAKKLFLTCTIVLVILAIFFLPNVLDFLYSIGAMPERYLVYSSRFLMNHINLNVTRELYFGILTIAAIAYKKRDNATNESLLAVVGFTVFQLGLISDFAYRASYLFFYPALFMSIPEAISLKKSNVLMTLLLIICMSTYWYQQIVVLRIHETYPYEIRREL